MNGRTGAAMLCVSLIWVVWPEAAALAAPPPATARPNCSLDLNGAWRAQPATAPDAPPAEGVEDWGSMNVPGQAQGMKRGKGDAWKGADTKKLRALWLERDVKVPGTWRGKRILLRSELIEQPAGVFVDGKKAGIFQPPGDEIELTGALKPGEAHVIRLFIARGEDVRQGAPHHLIPHIGPLGIAGSVRLDALAGRVAIDDVLLMPSTRKKQLGARIRFHCAKPEKNLTLRAVITEPKVRIATPRTIEAAVGPLPDGETFADVAFPWEDPILWELERPHIYRISISVLDGNGKTLDTWGQVPFGFREFWVEGRQMMLNGHPCRFRLLWHWGVGENNLAFYQGMGFNAVAIQPRDAPWFNNWGANGDIDKLARLLDFRGVALIATGKNINGIERLIKDSPAIRSYFKRASQIRISRYANHPSILVWNLSLNVGNSLEEWMPPHLGRAPKGERANHPVAMATDIVDKLDPTRSVMSHACGNVAPITSANVYLNFVPLQEREEWLSAWAEDGERPFAAIEFGTPYSANFFRKGGPEPLFTEYCAKFIGDEAYRLEKTAYVEKVEALTKTNTNGHGSSGTCERDGGSIPLQTFAAETTAFYPVVTEFVRRTNRAWRTWGFNGGAHPWMWMVGLGGKPGGPMGSFFYTHLEAPDGELRERPDWANPYYDAYRRTSQPLLAYIGGRAERFTAKDHAFFPGSKVDKQIIAVWDGGWETTVAADWEARVGARRIAGERFAFKLAPGEIRKRAFSFRIPRLIAPGPCRITLSVENPPGKKVADDTFRFQVVQLPRRTGTKAKMLLWDPKSESVAWISKLGPRAARWQPEQPIGDATALIIGRNALAGARELPFTAADVYRGLNVLVLEQQPETLRKFGFRVEDTYSRRLFPRVRDHPILAGIGAELLADWQGSAALLRERKPVDLNLVRPRPAHWGNYGVVASVVMEVPHRGNFTPIIDGEFVMRYSPLIEWWCGKGRVVFNQLDLTGRAGKYPTATLLAHNMLEYIAEPAPTAFRTAVYIGGPKGRKLVDGTLLAVDLDARPDKLPDGGLLIVGEGGGDQLKAHPQAIDRFVKSGGWVLSLPKTPAELNAGWLPFEVKTERRKAHRAGTEPIGAAPFRGLGPADFHWRDLAEFDVFTTGGQTKGAKVPGDGFFLLLANEKGGGWLLCQADPAQFAAENAGTVDLPVVFPASWHTNLNNKQAVPKPWLQYTRRRLDRMYSQIIANLGAAPGPKLRERMFAFAAGPKLAEIGGWQVAGPYENAGFDTPLPPEPGWPDTHPDRPAPDVKWQAARMDGPAVSAPDPRAVGRPSVTYFRTFIEWNGDASIPMRHNQSWRDNVAVWFNGEAAGRFKGEGWGPRWGVEKMLRLKKGRNELLLKVHGNPRIEVVAQQALDPRLGALGAELLYRDPSRYADDPYAWFPW